MAATLTAEQRLEAAEGAFHAAAMMLLNLESVPQKWRNRLYPAQLELAHNSLTAAREALEAAWEEIEAEEAAPAADPC